MTGTERKTSIFSLKVFLQPEQTAQFCCCALSTELYVQQQRGDFIRRLTLSQAASVWLVMLQFVKKLALPPIFTFLSTVKELAPPPSFTFLSTVKELAPPPIFTFLSTVKELALPPSFTFLSTVRIHATAYKALIRQLKHQLCIALTNVNKIDNT